MRELLFRGRFKVNKFRWNWTPREYEFIESKSHHVSAINFNNNGEVSHVVIPYKDTCITLFPDYFITFDIQQYTGLKDKNGVRIFEGDIIKDTNTPKHGYYIVADLGKEQRLFYVDSRDGWVSKTIVNFSNLMIKTVEVIGNIHDNPDLIK